MHPVYLKGRMSLSENQDVSGLQQTHQDKLMDTEVVRHHYDFLVDLMSPDFGLVDKLYSNETLSDFQKYEIKATPLIQNRNKILLKCIVQANACEKLLEALKECGQSHLVKYMEADGVYRPEFCGNWPLMEKERTILLKNYETLIDLLDLSYLTDLLYQSNVLNKRQLELVFSSKWKYNAEQNKLLLQFLRKFSLSGYWQMIRSLHASKQSHIAEIFESGGVVVRIDANLQTESSNLTAIENSIVAEVTSLLRRPSVCDASRLLEEVQLNLVGVAVKHSVSLYFLCCNQGEVDRLRQMTLEGQLIKFVEDFFNRLIDFPKRIKVTLKWSRHLFSKSRKHITAIEAKNSGDELKNTSASIESLPLEVLDKILQSAYLRARQRMIVQWLYVRSSTADGDENSDFIVILGSVNDLWFQRILRKGFKKPIWPQLERIYKENFNLCLNFRNCQHYLEEAIQVGKIRVEKEDLKAADFLTDLQIARIPRKRANDRRNRRRSEMLNILMREFPPVRRELEKRDIYYKFLRYLSHEPIPEVLEMSIGLTAKVTIRQPKSCKTNDWSREFTRKLNNLKYIKKLNLNDMETNIQELNDSGLDISNSFVDRDVIVWIWCRSQRAVETLKALNKSQTLIDLLYRIAKEENDRNRSSKNIHLEEYSHLKKHLDTSYFSNIVILEVEPIMARLYEYSIGVTKLKDKIFVLGFTVPYRTPVFGVCMFDDQRPFRFEWEMSLEDIENATDISSSEKNNCLYIADIDAKCIWRIFPPDEDDIEEGTYSYRALECPVLSNFKSFKMTVTVGGQILIIGDEKRILLFFESDSALNRRPIRIDLPDAIYRPEQVAENSAGNFIFLHRTRERYSSDDEDPRIVSEVDRNCKTIIRQHFGTGDHRLKPRGKAFLLIDPENRIFILDEWDNRLILLDSRLRFVRSFTLGVEVKEDVDEEDEDLLYPQKMFYDGGKNQLIVAGHDKVFVYKITRF